MREAGRGRVLHLLSQRPSHTGSGVTLDAIVREAAGAGWEQAVAVGVPAEDPRPPVGGLDASQVHPLVFGVGDLPFALPGMSDVMPYASTRFQDLDAPALDAYRRAWGRHLEDLVRRFRPDVIHAHHLWLSSSLVKDVAPDVPLVVQSHATGLRQMALCPHLACEVQTGAARADAILVLTHRHGRDVVEALGEPVEDRITVVGAGYRDEVFHAGGRRPHGGRRVVYAGKLSRAKGVPWLLDAGERLRDEGRDLRLDLAGSGAGTEADGIRERVAGLGGGDAWVRGHGHLEAAALAELLRASDVLVLPSLYEGLPLVVVEAVACGCRVVVTDLPTVREDLAPRLGSSLRLVPLPRREGPDRPRAEDLPRFVDDLVEGLAEALDAPPVPSPPGLEDFTWPRVFARVERVWQGVLDARAGGDLAAGSAPR